MELQNIHISEQKVFSDDLLEPINNLSRQLGKNPYLLDKDSLKKLIENQNTHLFLAKIIGKAEIVGMITLVTFRTPYTMKGALEVLVVDEKVRGQRLGERLLQSAIVKAKEEGVLFLSLTSNPTRLSANALYQRMGFEKYDTNVYKIQL